MKSFAPRAHGRVHKCEPTQRNHQHARDHRGAPLAQNTPSLRSAKTLDKVLLRFVAHPGNTGGGFAVPPNSIPPAPPGNTRSFHPIRQPQVVTVRAKTKRSARSAHRCGPNSGSYRKSSRAAAPFRYEFDTHVPKLRDAKMLSKSPPPHSIEARLSSGTLPPLVVPAGHHRGSVL